MTKIAIYYRVSTNKQDEDMQRREVESYIETRMSGDILTTVYIDRGISGAKSNRPEFQRMLADCREGLVDTILVYRLDRFSRDANTAIRLLLELDSAGVAFISVTQPVLNLGHDNPFRRTMMAAFAEIAEIERQTIVERVKSGLAAAKSRGVRLGAPSNVPEEIKDEARRLRESGLSFRDVSKRVGLSISYIHKLCA